MVCPTALLCGWHATRGSTADAMREDLNVDVGRLVPIFVFGTKRTIGAAGTIEDQHHATVVKQYPRNWKPSGSKPEQNHKDDQRDEHGK